MRFAKAYAIAGAVVVVLLTVTVVWAQQADATAHLSAAHNAAKRHDWRTALSEFSAAETAEESVEALQGVADAHFHLAHSGEAYEAYEALLARLSNVKMDRRKRAAISRIAGERFRELSTQTGAMQLTVPESGAHVFVDDRDLGTSPLSLSVRVAAGPRRVHAEASDGAKTEQSIVVAGGATVAVELQFARPKPPPSADAGTEAAADGGTPPPPEPPKPVPPKDAWAVPHGSVHYNAVRARTPPRIDGVLDDAVWKEAPRDSHFNSLRLKPYGSPTTEPTEVQIAYDDHYLYVAFTSRYSSVRQRDDSYPGDEISTVFSEGVGVFVDPLHDHANALAFITSRVGTRADVELTNSGSDPNADWKGIWEVATQRSADSWTAEFQIPWGTLRMPAHDGPFTLGMNFRRLEPIHGEYAMWSLQPPGTPGLFDTNYFGHVNFPDGVHPHLRLYLQPYVAIAYDQTTGSFRSQLNDFTGTQSNFRAYAGVYARYYPPGPLRVEVTANPDFSAVPPDQAVANFNRFELIYPEVRPFFAEDNPRFTFGRLSGGTGSAGSAGAGIGSVTDAQLFYSRRIGLDTNPLTGATTSVPIIYGAKAVVRTGGMEVAGMNVALSSADPKVTLNDNVGALRFTENFSEGRRVGFIALGRTGANGTYGAGGIDGVFTLYDRHVVLSGFLARTATQGQPSSGMGEAQIGWVSEAFYANASYLDVGTALDAQLGYVPVTGIRSNTVAAGYTPILHADLVQQLSIEGSLDMTRNRGDVRIYDHGAVAGTVNLINGASIQVEALPAIENVLTTFPLFAGRVAVQPGEYNEMALQLSASTAPRRPVVGSIGYLAGDLFAGQQQSPSASVGLNLGRVSANALYELFLVRYSGQQLVGHQVSATAGFAYTPLARTTLVVQANTLIDRAVAQLVTSYTFGLLSTVSLVLIKSTGANTVPANSWITQSAPFSAILSFAYGVSPF